MARIVIPCGRGRVGKTTLSQAIGEELAQLGERVTLFDLDRAPSLSKRTLSRRPANGSDRARRLALEDAIHEAIQGEAFDTAVVDIGGDDVLWHDITAKLPELLDLLDEAGVAAIAVHVLGPNADKDLAYYRLVWDTATFSSQLVVLNHGLAPEGIHPDDAFAAVRKAVNGAQPLVVRALPPEVIEIIETCLKGRTLAELADDTPTLKAINAAVLRSWLNKSIRPLVEAIRSHDAPASPIAA